MTSLTEIKRDNFFVQMTKFWFFLSETGWTKNISIRNFCDTILFSMFHLNGKLKPSLKNSKMKPVIVDFSKWISSTNTNKHCGTDAQRYPQDGAGLVGVLSIASSWGTSIHIQLNKFVKHKFNIKFLFNVPCLSVLFKWPWLSASIILYISLLTLWWGAWSKFLMKKCWDLALFSLKKTERGSYQSLWVCKGFFISAQQKDKGQQGQPGTQKLPFEHKEELIYYESNRALEHAAQRGYGASFAADIQDLTGCLSIPPAAGNLL